MKGFLYRITLIFSFLVVGFGYSAYAQDAVDGKNVFNVNCKSCHMMNRNLTGPALDGAFTRVQEFYGYSDEETTNWLLGWIRNSQAVIATGDEYANNIYNEWNKVQMNSFVSLSDDELLAVIDYIRYWDDETKYPSETPQVAAAPTGGAQGGAGGGLSTNLILLVLVVVLLLIALILARVTNVLGRVASAKEGEAVAEEKPFYLNKKFLTVIILIAIGFLGFRAVDGAISLGRQTNYAPEQPIHFSHKLHAGINQIDCKYCHVGVEKGKSATIPSTNICMNCHKYVNQGPSAEFKAANGLQGPGNDTTQIAKIYAAAGWDANTQSFDKSKAKPVEWVRIHNLPDHVYFNHAQHVKVGGLECQTCHGPIEEMDVVYQFSQLSMGWCVNCHRETEVQFDDNGYYDHYYEDYHEAIKNGEIEGVTVEMIGGTECQKCHY